MNKQLNQLCETFARLQEELRRANQYEMNGNELALGRNHTTADVASMTDFGDCFRVDLRWNDGAHVYAIYDTKEEADQHLNNLGFYHDA